MHWGCAKRLHFDACVCDDDHNDNDDDGDDEDEDGDDDADEDNDNDRFSLKVPVGWIGALLRGIAVAFP